MNPDIQKAVEAGKISKSVAGILEHFTSGACVLHKNWGFGQIANIDFLINQITIDFATKKVSLITDSTATNGISGRWITVAGKTSVVANINGNLALAKP